ncbi:MAG: hypothetical protein WD873_06005, partial [Candidatus Hydrogenedentales bacterium]
EFTKTKSLVDLVGIELDFSEALGRKVDLVTPAALSPYNREEVLRDFDDMGLRGLLQRHADAVREVGVATETVLTDMDYPEDYRAALAALGEASG